MITYGPRKAVAEVSNHNEPIGRGCVALVRKAIDVRLTRVAVQVAWQVNWFWLSFDLRFTGLLVHRFFRFKWVGCQLLWDSVCQVIWDSNDLDVNWFEIQMTDSLSDWRQTNWLSNWLPDQKRSISTRLPSKMKLWSSKTKLFCETSFKMEAFEMKNEAFLRDFLQKRSFEDQKPSFSAGLPSKTKLWRSKTKLFCETSFKNEALKIKNEAFVRDFLQKWSFEAQKRSFCARLPSKMQLWSSKTKLLCETSFQNEPLKLKNEAFVREFLQKWSFEDQKRSFCARLPSKMKLWSSKTKLLCETSFQNEASNIKNETFLRDFLQKWHVDRTLGLRMTIRF